MKFVVGSLPSALILILSFLTTKAWACPTCGVSAAFGPQTLLLSLLFALVPLSLMFFLGWRIFREEQFRTRAKKNSKVSTS